MTAEHPPRGSFLVCDTCEYCCFVTGGLANALAVTTPPCPGCRGPTRLARTEPWRDRIRKLGHAS